MPKQFPQLILTFIKHRKFLTEICKQRKQQIEMVTILWCFKQFTDNISTLKKSSNSFNTFLEDKLEPEKSIKRELNCDNKFIFEIKTQLVEILTNYTEEISDKNYMTMHIWRRQDSKDENRCVKLTDCIIKVDDEQFRANISVLATSSEVIFNLINDFKHQQQKQNYDSPMDLSALFTGFSKKHVHIYLCAIYNPNFKFFMLDDILNVLKLSIKLDNQSLLQKILNMERLGEILEDQVLVEDEFSQDPCFIENIREFAHQHRLHELTLFCEAYFLHSRKRQKY
eukprot:TRINITY_DN28869_c0_g1_i4.p1 TRINITY_DN28869_c0_g1~~TRINITY_DN28869_c0_g1_i4.p1  ORF type:complete len:283 (-),score=18.51 TRINITY_DN28869_c0_g1_i4:277-1125(-)